MTLRQPHCRACAELTSGDCGAHGPVQTPPQEKEPAPDPDAALQAFVAAVLSRGRQDEAVP